MTIMHSSNDFLAGCGSLRKKRTQTAAMTASIILP
jgi:hypothetical protein